MTLNFDLTPEEEDLLLRFSTKARRSIDGLARLLLLSQAQAVETAEQEGAAYDAANPIPPGGSVYDSIKDYIGLFESGGETGYSENTGEKFTDALVEKHRQGRL